MDIIVDMFEVQLGASILLRFNQGGDRFVTVLADGGTKGGKYPKEHVLNKLKEVLPIDDEQNPPRIDLLIGTHYDQDHLNCLVPVIEAYEIGEAWMPPIANDAEQPAADWEEPRNSNLLGPQLAGEQGNKKLEQYLLAKRDIIERVANVRKIMNSTEEGVDARQLARSLSSKGLVAQEEEDTSEDYFQAVRKRVVGKDAEDTDHACKEVRPPFHFDDMPQLELDKFSWLHEYSFRRNHGFDWDVGENQNRSLSFIEKSAAEDALTARYLKDVVDALEAKGISTRYESVNDGEPKLYAWKKAERRFSRVQTSRGLTLTLLGPSKGLISKYWRRLPIGEYITFALQSRLPVESITPQNELSYAMIFSYEDQGVLISGDTGFVDFVPLGQRFDPTNFYPKLIRALNTPLPVVQVAHHGGHNKYFYHAMEAARYPVAKGKNYLLLSHEEHAKSRPSGVFSEFITRLDLDEQRIQLLFTSQPKKENSADYEYLFSPPVPGQEASSRGDVRLVYEDGQWVVQKHAVEPA